MHLRTWPTTPLALLATLCAALDPRALSAQNVELRALDGEWVYVEDRTEGREIEKHQPSINARIKFRVEEDAVVWLRSKTRIIRLPLDGSPTEEVSEQGNTSHYRGAWKDGAFEIELAPVRPPGSSSSGVIRWVLRVTADGLLASVASAEWKSVALYRHPQDIALPTPAKASIGDVAWMTGDWVGTKGTAGTTSIEERWSSPLGGAMLAVARTVSRGKMSAFEFLRVVERDGGLVYVAQPNGSPPTEFVLTELGAKRAVFENPRHDSPQRIVYELSAEGRLSASIGYTKGGRPQRFEFARESR